MRYYMKIDGVTGGANYLGSNAWSSIDSLDFDAPPAKSVRITRHSDFITPRLMALASAGKMCPMVVIDCLETVCGANVLVMEIKLEQVLFVYMLTNAVTQIESFELNYDKFYRQYYPYQPRPTISAVPTAPARRTW